MEATNKPVIAPKQRIAPDDFPRDELIHSVNALVRHANNAKRILAQYKVLARFLSQDTKDRVAHDLARFIRNV